MYVKKFMEYVKNENIWHKTALKQKVNPITGSINYLPNWAFASLFQN